MLIAIRLGLIQEFRIALGTNYMTLTALEFLKNRKLKDLVKDYEDGVCTICLKVTMHHDNVEPTSTGYAHFDCYWDTLSEVLERSPIRTPGIRRG